MAFAQTPTVGSCTVLPANNVWNTPVDKLPVDKNSAAYISSMNATKSTIYPVFNSTGWGMPYNTVSGAPTMSPVTFYYGGSDAGSYPLASNVTIQVGSDHHAIIVDTANCTLYELFNLSNTTTGWNAGSGAIFPLNSNGFRPAGWTSADAAGLPIFPGMVRADEVLAGHINHALRVTADHTRNAYIWPARHAASSLTGTQYPPMGQRFRLKASFDISKYKPQAQVILQAMKTYGLILADNGASWDLTGAGDSRWDDAALNSIKSISGNNFEAIDESSLIVDANSGQAKVSSATVTIPTGWTAVVSKNSGKCFDMRGGVSATQPAVVLQQWACSGQANQQFKFTPVTGGYQITVRHSGLAMQLADGTESISGTAVEQWGYEGAAYQIWTIGANADGTFTFSPKSNAKACMDVAGVSTTDGTKVQQWNCSGGNNQRWTFVPVS